MSAPWDYSTIPFGVADTSYGDKCKFSHGKGEGRNNGRGPPSHVNNTAPPVAGTIAITVDDSFPTIDNVAQAHSDSLIFPIDARPSKTVTGIIYAMEKSGMRLENAADVETLIWALAQSNAHNTGWVSV